MTDQFRFGVLWRQVPRPVWALVVLLGFLLALHALITPLFRAPDEMGHVDLVFAARAGLAWPEPGERLIDERVVAARRAANFGDQEYPHQAEDAPSRSERPQLADLDIPADQRPVGNKLAQHPPLYWVLLALPTTVVTALVPLAWGWAFDELVLFLRLLNTLFVLPVPLFCYVAARRLSGREAVGIAAAVFPFAVPQFAHIGAAVSNDNALVLFGGLLTVVLTFVVTGDTSRRTAVIVGILTGLALLTKGFALLVPAWIAVAYGLAFLRHDRRRALVGAVLAAGLGLALGGWWYVRNLLVAGHLAPGARPETAPPGFVPDWSLWAYKYVELLNQRFWGSFGYVEVNLPPALAWAAGAAAVLGLALALVLRRRIDRRATLDVLFLLVPVACIAAMLLYNAAESYVRVGLPGRGVQGRYLFFGMTGLAVAVALGYAALGSWVRRWLPLALLFAAGLLQLVALRDALLHYWGPEGADSLRGSAAAVLAWSPIPPLAVGLICLGLAGAGVTVALMLVGGGLRPETQAVSADAAIRQRESAAAR